MQSFLLKPSTENGVRRGLSKEYTGEEKTPMALQIAVANAPEYSEFRVSVTDVVVDALTQSKNGDKLLGKYENNTYYVEGTAKFWFRHQETDRVLEPKVLEWRLSFSDSVEPLYGTPDVKVVSFEATAP